MKFHNVPIPTLLAMVLTTCDAAAPIDEPAAEVREYAVYPLTVAPDHFAMTIGEFVDIFPVGTTGHAGPVHTAYVVNGDPKLVECRDGGEAGWYDCSELERAGWIVMNAERAGALLAGSGCNVPATAGGGRGRNLVVSVGSCLGLVRYEYFYDSTGVVFGWEAPVPANHWFKPIRCGETWAGYRLKATSWTDDEYPVDEVFSDTVWLSVRGC